MSRIWAFLGVFLAFNAIGSEQPRLISKTFVECRMLLRANRADLQLPYAENADTVTWPGSFNFELGMYADGRVAVLVPRDLFALVQAAGAESFPAVVGLLHSVPEYLAEKLGMTPSQFEGA